jgi:archaemetzincin
MEEKILVLQPFGYIEERVISELQKGLKPFFKDIVLNEELPIPDDAWDVYRKQFLVDDFLRMLRDVKGDKVLGIVDRDLYTPELNFIFGKARIHGNYCIIALDRLRSGATKKMFLQRVVKTAIHELGHTWGLRHCDDKMCAMHFSDTLTDTDLKLSMYCKKCEKKKD